MITPLSKYTVQNMLDKFRWGNLTEDQKISILNSAQEEVATFINMQTTRTDYTHDTISDSDEVLAPTQAGLASIYSEYLEVTIGASVGSGGTVGAKALVVGGMAIGSSSVAVESGLLKYTINLTGGTFDGRMQVEPPFPNDASFEKLDSDTLLVRTGLVHDAFSFWLKKHKES